MPFNKLNLITAAILALIFPLLLVACGEEDADTQPQLSRSQIEEIVRAEVARAPVAPALTQADVEGVVNAAVQGIPQPELTQDDVEQVVQTAVEAAMAQMSEKTLAEVQHVVQEAIADLPKSGPGLTSAEVQAIVQAAIPEPGLTLAEVEALVQEAIAAIVLPEPGLTQEEVRRLARNAVADIPLRADLAEYTKFFVQNAISRYNEEGLDDTLSYYNSPGKRGWTVVCLHRRPERPHHRPLRHQSYWGRP